MKRNLFFVVLLMTTATSNAIQKNDYATSISKNTLFVAAQDLVIPANDKSVDVVSTKIRSEWLTCILGVTPDNHERVFKAGSTLTVNRTEKVKSGYFHADGYAAVIYFDHSVLQKMKCFTGDRLADNHWIPSFEDVELGLQNKFGIVPAAPEEIPGAKVCTE